MVHVDTYAIHGSSGWWSKNNPVDAERRNQGSVLHSWKVNIYGPLMSLEFYRPRRKVAFQPQFFQGPTIFSGAMRLCYISREGKTLGDIKTVLLHTIFSNFPVGLPPWLIRCWNHRLRTAGNVLLRRHAIDVPQSSHSGWALFHDVEQKFLRNFSSKPW